MYHCHTMNSLISLNQTVCMLHSMEYGEILIHGLSLSYKPTMPAVHIRTSECVLILDIENEFLYPSIFFSALFLCFFHDNFGTSNWKKVKCRPCYRIYWSFWSKQYCYTCGTKFCEFCSWYSSLVRQCFY